MVCLIGTKDSYRLRACVA